MPDDDVPMILAARESYVSLACAERYFQGKSMAGFTAMIERDGLFPGQGMTLRCIQRFDTGSGTELVSLGWNELASRDRIGSRAHL